MIDDHHAAYNHAANCITLSTDPVHMVEILKIAYGISSKSWGMSWMRKGEEVGLYISKASVRIFMQLNAG